MVHIMATKVQLISRRLVGLIRIQYHHNPHHHQSTHHSLTQYHHRRFANNNKRCSLLFLGAPGVGKGTFSKRIAPKFNAKIMTSSDLLRDAADSQCQSGNEEGKSNGEYIKQCIQRGQLVSDDIVIPIVIDFLRTVAGSFIFDGFPRTLNQAQRLQQEYPLDLGIYFKLPHHSMYRVCCQ